MKKINILILSLILLTTSCHLPDNTTDYVDKLVVFGKLDMLQISADEYQSSMEVTVSMSSSIDSDIEHTNELYINDAAVKIIGKFNLDENNTTNDTITLIHSNIDKLGTYYPSDDNYKIWPNSESENVYVTEQLTRHVRMALLVASDEIFNNVKVIPFLASIFLLITTYFITIKFSKKNFTGLIAVILVLQSSTFFTYDTIAVYENFWVLFYVLSIYLIFQKPKISSISYILSIFSKAITILMLPVTIIVTLLTDIPSKKKIFVIISHILVLIVSIIIFQFSNTIYGSVIDVNTSEFLIGFSTLAFNLRFDVFLLLFLLPVSLGLFLKARNGCRNSISLMVLMCGTILVTPVLEMMTNFYFVYPYRYVPLVIFFAISLASLFSKK